MNADDARNFAADAAQRIYQSPSWCLVDRKFMAPSCSHWSCWDRP